MLDPSILRATPRGCAGTVAPEATYQAVVRPLPDGAVRPVGLAVWYQPEIGARGGAVETHWPKGTIESLSQ
jgi:hypothetical protein